MVVVVKVWGWDSFALVVVEELGWGVCCLRSLSCFARSSTASSVFFNICDVESTARP